MWVSPSRVSPTSVRAKRRRLETSRTEVLDFQMLDGVVDTWSREHGTSPIETFPSLAYDVSHATVAVE